MTALAPPVSSVVIDTNVVLDLLVFADPSVAALRRALSGGDMAWLATAAMREELQRVLGYPAMVAALAARGLTARETLSRFDGACVLHAVAPASSIRCSDPDDQPFIDLAVAHRALLLSKDHAVLRLRRRMAAIGVSVQSLFSLPPV